MKKLLIAVAALAGFGTAYAGDYHHGEELKCQQCHTMHATRQHGFEIKQTDGTIAPLPPTEGTGMFNGGAGFDKLLVGGSTNATCLACHNRGGYDVWGSTASATMAGKRSAGALNADPAATDLADKDVGYTPGQTTPTLKYVAQMGHSMGSKAVAPGGNFFQNNSTYGFNCGDCHEVHGNAAYRNLGPQYSGIVAFDAASQPTYVVAATVDPTVDVTETEAAQYDGSGVFFGFGGGANRMNAYCGKCHGNFHGDTNTQNATATAFVRHPTGNAVSKYDFATSDGRYTARDAVRAVYTSATTVSPGCLSCHKAHGNARSYGLIHPAEAGANVDLENGDAPGVTDYSGTRTFYNPKTLCTTCHYQGKH